MPLPKKKPEPVLPETPVLPPEVIPQPEKPEPFREPKIHPQEEPQKENPIMPDLPERE